MGEEGEGSQCCLFQVAILSFVLEIFHLVVFDIIPAAAALVVLILTPSNFWAVLDDFIDRVGSSVSVIFDFIDK